MEAPHRLDGHSMVAATIAALGQVAVGQAAACCGSSMQEVAGQVAAMRSRLILHSPCSLILLLRTMSTRAPGHAPNSMAH